MLLLFLARRSCSAAILFWLLSVPTPVQSQSQTSPPKSTTVIQAPVIVNGETLFSVGGPDPQARAQRINTRIQTLITRTTDVQSFNVEKQGESYLIQVGDIPVLTVTATDAQDALTDPQSLAKDWGAALTDAVKRARVERDSWVQRILNPVRRSFNQLFVSLLETLPRLISAVLLLISIVFFARLVRGAMTPAVRRLNLDDNLRQLITSLAYYGAWVFGLMIIASVLGFQASSLIAALGVSGFVLGFAFKDILSHFLAGILLLAGRSFQIGDQIAVKEYEGTVERIDLRATHLRTYDNRLVIIPNADVFTTAVVNNTQSQRRRQEFDIGIDYSANIAEAQLLAFHTLKDTEGILSDPSPDVLVADLAASWVTLRCRFWTDSHRANVLAVGSEARRRVKDAFDREKIYLPFDITEVHFDPKLETPLKRMLAAISVPNPKDGQGERNGPEIPTENQDIRPRSFNEEESQSKAEAALPQAPSPEAS